MIDVALSSDVARRHRRLAAAGRLAWPAAAAVIGVISLAAWVAIAALAMRMFRG